MTTRFIVRVAVAMFAVAISGCGKKLNPEADGLACDEKSGVCAVAISIGPGPTTYTNGSVTIHVDVKPAGHAPERVQLLKNSQSWITLTAPAFDYKWNTTADSEGSYQIVASASVAGDVVTSAPIMVVVDRTAPTVGVTPASAATNVDLSDPVRVTFSEAVDPATVPGSAVTLKDGSGATIASTSTLSADGTTIAVAIANRSSLTFPLTISAKLSDTIKDKAGNPVVALSSWSWTAPPWVRLPSLLGASPSLALDQAGKPILAYLKTPATTSTSGPIGIATYKVGSTWDLSGIPPTADPAASVVITTTTTADLVLAWAQQQSGHLHVARRAGTTWTEFGTNADAGLSWPGAGVSSLAIDGGGAPVVAAWQQSDALSARTGYVLRWDGSAWQALGGSFNGAPNLPLMMVLDSAGAPLLWVSYALKRYVSDSWFDIDTSGFTLPALAIDAQDRPILAVSSGNPTNLDVKALVANTWQAFSPAVTTTTTGIGEADIAVTSDGRPVVAWVETVGSGSRQDLHVARHTGQGWDVSFGTLNGLSTADAAVAHATVVVDAFGAPCVAWDAYDSTTSSTSVYVWKSNR